MNKATEFDNWRRGGNHYVLRATADNKWVGFQESVINALKSKFDALVKSESVHNL